MLRGIAVQGFIYFTESMRVLLMDVENDLPQHSPCLAVSRLTRRPTFDRRRGTALLTVPKRKNYAVGESQLETATRVSHCPKVQWADLTVEYSPS